VIEQKVSWQIMAILIGHPEWTEERLYDEFGNGRASFGLIRPGEKVGTLLFALKEVYPPVFYIGSIGG
jgi:hypothetical protein